MFRLVIILFTVLSSQSVYSQDATESVPIDVVGNLILVDVFINEHDEPLCELTENSKVRIVCLIVVCAYIIYTGISYHFGKAGFWPLIIV